jgi:hypothetical protein
MSDYRGRLLNVLQTSRASFPTIPSIGSFPTVGLNTEGVGGVIATVTPYILWMLLFIFIAFLILIIINYTVYPIFNFGDNPNALITVPQTQWVNSWPSCPATGCIDAKSTNTVSAANYSILVDVKITNPAPSTTTSNTFVLLYKTPNETLPSSTLGSAATENPSLVVAYDSLASKIFVYLTTKMTDNSYALQVVSSECIPSVPYRIGIIVSSSLVELHMNGSYMSSKSFAGQTVVGTDKDYIHSAPSTYSKNVQVANLFTANYVVSSGEIKSMGGPALTA